MKYQAFHAIDRSVLRVCGSEATHFLQGLLSNDIERLETEPVIYSAVLSPQGKYLSDFFVTPDPDGYRLDVDVDQVAGLVQRLNMYRLRAKVEIVQAPDLHVVLGTGDMPDGAVPDPRVAAMGWRAMVSEPGPICALGWSAADYMAARVEHIVPQSGIELIPGESFILEMGFERLNGVDFKKGCYVGQEVTARMKHKTTLKKGLSRVSIEGAAPPGTEIMTQEGKQAGTLYTISNGLGLAYLRFDRATGPLTAGTACLSFPEA